MHIKNHQRFSQSLFISIILLFISCRNEIQDASLIVTNANIWTGNINQPKAEAMAIISDSIIAIGTSQEIENYKGTSTNVLDMEGRFITPGFIDTHVHLMMGGNSLLSVELRDANTKEEFTKRIAEFAKTIQPETWILEGNWDHTLWGGELPKKEWIDEFTSENPVVIYRLDGHMVLANSLALELAGIDENTPDVFGGEIIRNGDGSLTGILKDNAMIPLLEKIPPLTQIQKLNGLKAAMSYLASNGVTSVHDVDTIGTFQVASKLKNTNELITRIYSVDPLNHWKKRLEIEKTNDKWLKTGGLKGFVDGSLGSHTAAFNEPYLDKPDNNGFFINEEVDLYQWILDADKENLQVMVHAIGDRAINSLLNIYERIVKEEGKKDRRLRLEHAQHIASNDIKRFAELGIIASVQPYHVIDDGRWAEELIGAERIKTTYAFNSLLENNGKIVFGSDWPVAPATPLYGIYAAATRRTLDDKNPNGWVPEQKISVEQALKSYTIDAAYAAFDETTKGSLEPGKLADFVVLSDDVTNIEPLAIRNLKVLQTFVGGKKVFDNQ